jgi:hypothetical protein
MERETLEHVRTNVRQYTDRAYLTRYEGIDERGFHYFSTVLNHPDGPIMWSYLRPDGRIDVYGRDTDGVMRILAV